jgi:hypothetical protein
LLTGEVDGLGYTSIHDRTSNVLSSRPRLLQVARGQTMFNLPLHYTTNRLLKSSCSTFHFSKGMEVCYA